MLKISDFSKLSRISIRMLRFYDEKGILKPSLIKKNGYRYYDAKQLLVALHIQYLRYLDFSTNDIKYILKTYQNNEDISKYLQLHLEQLKEKQNEISEKISALTKTIEKIKEEETIMNYQVEIKTIPAMNVISKRGIIPTYKHEGLLWQGLLNEIKERNIDIKRVENGMIRAIFYDTGYKENDVDVEIQYEVKGKYDDTDNIKFKITEPTQVASITFTGDYEHIKDVSFCIANWISKHNYEICGPDFAIYHIGYYQTQDPNEFVTEICYPIR